MYFKVINDDKIIGVVTEVDFCRYQTKHGVILLTDIDHGEFVMLNEVLYRDNWLKLPPVTTIDYVEAKITRIEQDEYDALAEALKTEEEIVVKEEPEEPVELEIQPEDTTTIDYIIDMKVKEMRRECHNVITNGVDVQLSDGNTYHFSMAIEDQINLQNLVIRAQSNENDSFPWHDDNGLCKFYSSADILLIYNEFEELKTYHTTYFNSLKHYILSLTDINDVKEIQYGITVPDEYQSEVLKHLLEQDKEVS